MKKFRLSRIVVAVAALAMLANSIAPSSAATLRVPKTAFPACAVQNGVYCIESVTVTTAQGKVVPLQWVANGVAVPGQSATNGISFAPIAKVVKGIVKENGWWTTQYQREALVAETTVFTDITSLVGTAEFPEIGARYDSATKTYYITKPVEACAAIIV